MRYHGSRYRNAWRGRNFRHVGRGDGDFAGYSDQCQPQGCDATRDEPGGQPFHGTDIGSTRSVPFGHARHRAAGGSAGFRCGRSHIATATACLDLAADTGLLRPCRTRPAHRRPRRGHAPYPRRSRATSLRSGHIFRQRCPGWRRNHTHSRAIHRAAISDVCSDRHTGADSARRPAIATAESCESTAAAWRASSPDESSRDRETGR